MSANLVEQDITLMRARYNEALSMLGIPCRYQYPIQAGTNAQGESVSDGVSEPIDTYVVIDGNPKLKTYKRLGWVVENEKNLPFLAHCSFDLPCLQKDCIFSLSGQYTNFPDRVFRVTELTCDMQAPDHMIAQIVPVYESQVVGKTEKEVSEKYNRSSHFIQTPIDYRGNYISEQGGER